MGGGIPGCQANSHSPHWIFSTLTQVPYNSPALGIAATFQFLSEVSPHTKWALWKPEASGGERSLSSKQQGVVGLQTRSVQECLGVCPLDLSFWVFKLGIMDGTLLILDFQGTLGSNELEWEELHVGASCEFQELDHFGGGTKRTWKWSEGNKGR